MANYQNTITGVIYTESEIDENIEKWYEDYTDNYETDLYDPQEAMTFEEFFQQTWAQMVETEEEAN